MNIKFRVEYYNTDAEYDWSFHFIVDVFTVDVIYLNFAKAFDSINGRFVLAKMKSFGLGGIVVRLIESYLSGRVSREHVIGEHWRTIPKHSGFP